MNEPPKAWDEAGLIGSDEIEGTGVFRSNGEKIGTIERLMIDRHHGCVAYAVMSFGGFMGIGHDHYPLPWAMLKFNNRLGGYEVNLSDRDLNTAPRYGQHDRWDWSDRERGEKVYEYYRVAPYWKA